MKYLEEFRKPQLVKALSDKIHKVTTQPWTIMEVCGGQTHSIVKFGLQHLLPDSHRLIHGPGCPVCVTSEEIINHAIYIAKLPNLIMCSYGDMLRVPGDYGSLMQARAEGADIRMIHSPLEVIDIATTHPTKQVVLFGIGFETTAPAHAMTVYLTEKYKIANLSLLSSHVLVPPALQYLLSDPQSEVKGFLAAGHVCTVAGYRKYQEIAAKYRVPIVITGFEPIDILQGILTCTEMLEANDFSVKNPYYRCASEQGNKHAIELMDEVFTVADTLWRGIGNIPASGLRLKDKYKAFDASLRFLLPNPSFSKHNLCLSGSILQGKLSPKDCPFFNKECTPAHPLGAPMVSTEGACSAYYLYSHQGSL
ncbi:MAG: hydrogenase formation protein HypD [Chlamydiae bacterium]|nr:hydrogenase formation protein HypD [Chlamydiota bacterium]